MNASDPYDLKSMEDQSATVYATKPLKDPNTDVRGNTVLKPRSTPTQAEVDALLKRG
jgi:hypothetical protein